MEQIPFGTDSFATNPEPRVPSVLVLDVSSSMAGEPIAQLNDGLVAYKDELSADSLASKRVEVALVTFGSEVNVLSEFTTAESFFPPKLEANGYTYMGQAVSRAMELLEARKQEYRTNGIDYFRPWMFLISDGAPNDQGWEAVAAKAVEAQTRKAFQMFCVGVGEADLKTLKKFCTGDPIKLKGLRFRDMFLWLSSSQQQASRSKPGEDVPLENPVTPGGWGSIG